MPFNLVAALLFDLRLRLIIPTAFRVIGSAVLWTLLCFAAVSALKRSASGGRVRQIWRAENALFAFWIILLFPWLCFIPLAGLAFDGGYSAEAYVYFWTALTYPLSAGLTAILRRWSTWAVLLPLVNFAGCFSSGLLHHPH